MKRYILCITCIILIIIGIGLYQFDIAPFNLWQFDWTYEKEGTFEAVIISEKQETQYKKSYIAKIKDRNVILYISNKIKNIEIGDILKVTGEFKEPDSARNDGTFDYKLYLKTQKISGSFFAQNVQKVGINNSIIYKIKNFFNAIRRNAQNNFRTNLKEENFSLLNALVLGDKTTIGKDIVDSFRDSSLSHIIAISGTHFALITGSIIILFKKIKRKRLGQLITILVIIFYASLIVETPSVSRAAIMTSLIILSSVTHRQYSFWNAIFLSSVIEQIQNPYVIFSMSYLLSYLGAIGIVLFYKIVGKKVKSKVLTVTLSANLVLIPITLYNFNTVSLSFIISNFGASIIISPIVILGFISIFIPIKFIFIVLEILLSILNWWAKFCSSLPLSKVFLPSVSLISLILFYISLFVIRLYIIEKKRKSVYLSGLRHKFKRSTLKRIAALLIVLTILFNINYLPLKLKTTGDILINFIDVGQGDSCMIRINNKVILVDGGGLANSNSDYDIGEYVTLPYVLGQKLLELDYIIVSHFDADHVEGLMKVIEELKVKNIIISKQPKETVFYKRILAISKAKNINLIYVKTGDSFKVDSLEFLVLHPQENFIDGDDLNNNAILFKMIYNNFSMLFTGDVEKIGEDSILKNIKNKEILKSTILKVGHHGSKTSTSKEFLEAISPSYALIGVGKDNKFGHPNDEVIERLKERNIKIYRTDLCGEIKILVSKNGRIKIETKL